MSPAKEAPLPTPETRPFWEACARGELRLQRCGRCEAFFFYPRPACPRCGLDDRVTWEAVSGAATLHSYVISHVPAPGYEEEVPFVVAVVELAEGPRMLTNIVGVAPEPDSLPLDMALLVDFEARGETRVPVFRPAGGTGRP